MLIFQNRSRKQARAKVVLTSGFHMQEIINIWLKAGRGKTTRIRISGYIKKRSELLSNVLEALMIFFFFLSRNYHNPKVVFNIMAIV